MLRLCLRYIGYCLLGGAFGIYAGAGAVPAWLFVTGTSLFSPEDVGIESPLTAGQSESIVLLSAVVGSTLGVVFARILGCERAWPPTHPWHLFRQRKA